MAPPLPLAAYDRILVGISGGKDSVAVLLAPLEAGADPARIELHHHEADGRGPPFQVSQHARRGVSAGAGLHSDLCAADLPYP